MPSIKAHHLSKKFARSLKRAMTYGLIDIAKATLIPHRFRSSGLSTRLSDLSNPRTPELQNPSTPEPQNPKTSELPKLRTSEFWALSDISFEIQRGECVGIIGHNGAGKSTLFSLLSGIYGPTRGRIEIQGKLQALIALGAGFHPMLSGRENIYINAAILGMGANKIDALIDRIIDFAELRDFVDAPIKNYSSGMLVRLGFSVAAHMEPEVLLVDEVLAVGDMSFQRKCLEFMQNLYTRDVTVVLVSHNMAAIEAVSKRVMWLDKGRLRADGKPSEVIADYATSQLRKGMDGSQTVGVDPMPGEVLTIRSLRTTDLNGVTCKEFKPGEPIVIHADYIAHQRIEKPHFHLTFTTGPVRVFDASMLIDGQVPAFIEGPGVMRCIIPRPTLMPNIYRVSLAVRSKEAVYDLFSKPKAAQFMVGVKEEGITDAPCAVSLQIMGSLVSQEYQWDLHSGKR